MQCPNCNFQAAESAFGEPARCPDCGLFYYKALSQQRRVATHGAGAGDSSHPPKRAAFDAPEEEKVFLEAQGIKVTNARFIANKQTYAMASVNSVGVKVTDKTPQTDWPLTICVTGGVLFVWPLLAMLAGDVGPGTYAWLVLPLAMFGGGLLARKKIERKFKYTIVLTTSSGEQAALSSFSEPGIRVVEEALNRAIVYRG